MLVRLVSLLMLFSSLTVVTTSWERGRRTAPRPVVHVAACEHRAPVPEPVPAPPDDVTVLHLSAAMPASAVPGLIKLSLTERVHAVDGVLASSPETAVALLVARCAELGTRAGAFTVTIDDERVERRVLVVRDPG